MIGYHLVTTVRIPGQKTGNRAEKHEVEIPRNLKDQKPLLGQAQDSHGNHRDPRNRGNLSREEATVNEKDRLETNTMIDQQKALFFCSHGSNFTAYLVTANIHYRYLDCEMFCRHVEL